MKANLIFAGLLVCFVWGGALLLASALAHADQITVIQELKGQR